MNILRCVLLIIALGSFARAETVPQFVQKEEEIREYMIQISRELGVTCATCHNVQNFKSSDMQTYKVSKEHMKITQMLKENGFDGKKGAAANCYMCHRGKLMPDYKEPIAAKIK
ncbi:Photosynthetic reaction centre cytochrome C subunit [compost metagenome]